MVCGVLNGEKMNDDTKIITGDKEMPEGKLADGDKEVLRSAATGEGLIEITSVEQLARLALAAQETRNIFVEIVQGMTEEQAYQIKAWRCMNGYIWRMVAQEAYSAGFCGADWSPPSNQIMGMALCEKAAAFFGEDYMVEPWN